MTLARLIEANAAALLYGGLVIAAIAWIWLLVRAFRQSAWWGLFALVVPPAALLFALRHSQKAIAPVVVFVLGGVVAAVPAFCSLLGPADLNVRESLREPPKVVSLAGSALESDAAHEWMEDKAFFMQSGGLAIAAAAWIWLLVRAFRQHRRWGLGSLLVPPVGVAFTARHPRQGGAPFALFLVSILIAALPALYTLYVPLDLGPVEKMVDGERHLTLTGWDRKDYSVIKLRPDVVLLQMANPDVTDGSLEWLKGMKKLRELDLSGTQVTDAGLKALNELPALATLRLARTKITDKGFQDNLFKKDSLVQLNLSGTQVSRETGTAWQKAKPGRHILHERASARALTRMIRERYS